MRILHIITGLGDGGAEGTLYKICKHNNINEHIVISLRGPEKYYFLLKKLGIQIHCLNINKFTIFIKFFSLLKLIKFFKPDIVQTWLIHSDFIGGIAAKLSGFKSIIWNIRYTDFHFGKSKLTSIIILKILRYLSFFIPISIILNSKRARKLYKIKGYDKKKFIFIPNGFEPSIFKHDKLQRKRFRDKLRIKKNTILIGNIARYHPKKDHANLIQALNLLKLKKYNFLCILVGHKITKHNLKLNSLIKKFELSDKVKLLGQRKNITEILNGIDIYVQSSSYGEGFPNVVAEAMSCGTPCIATDVGDSSSIVGKTGQVISPSDSIMLCKAIEKAINQIATKQWNKKKKDCKLRIKNHFNIKKMILDYNNLWSKFEKKN
jgi:glycosyltransferase involved in cell wall biosynthesis